jgi:hypothetical protein
MTSFVLVNALAAQAAHIAEVNPGAAVASSFVRYYDYTGPLNVSPAPAAKRHLPASPAPRHSTG